METTRVTIELDNTNQNASREDIKNFYDDATEDYSFWSQDLNMHFGYSIPFKTNFLKRDSMLNEMNNQIYKRLDLKKGQNLVIDLGCGMGGTMRHFLNRNKDLQILGITRAPFQVTEGNKLLKKHHAVIINKDSTKMNITDRTVGGCIGIESLCHSGHSYKSLKEAFRILKPGGKFVIGDAFIKKAQENLCVGSSYSYKNLCKGWSLDALGLIQNVEEKLLAIGFKQVTIEDISIRVAPSVLHVPFAITAFLLKSLFSRKNVKPQSWNNLKASFFALLSGLHIKDFGYYLITATK